jgi:hypothetical protein
MAGYGTARTFAMLLGHSDRCSSARSKRRRPRTRSSQGSPRGWSTRRRLRRRRRQMTSGRGWLREQRSGWAPRRARQSGRLGNSPAASPAGRRGALLAPREPGRAGRRAGPQARGRPGRRARAAAERVPRAVRPVPEPSTGSAVERRAESREPSPDPDRRQHGRVPVQS